MFPPFPRLSVVLEIRLTDLGLVAVNDFSLIRRDQNALSERNSPF